MPRSRTDATATMSEPGCPREELRFGVVLNGGVSLAVWMGGAVLELDRLTKAGRERGTVYARMLRLAGCVARADVIAGTSAGGINGAALALSQVNRRAQLSDLRDIWVDQGRIESLLRQPFRGSPTSLLRGDEFFLPRLNEALTRLAVPNDIRDATDAPVDLTITTTVLRGNQTVTVDSMGQLLPQNLHAASFHWRRPPMTKDQEERADGPFAAVNLERTAHRMALAARCTASFPVAFEPVFVPVGSPHHRDRGDRSPLTEEQVLRPDMSDCVADWGHAGARDRSRYVVDGGLLANTPTRAALAGVESMPASGPVRRVMLLVYPHAPEPGPDLPDSEVDAPSLASTVGGLLGALTSQGSRTFVEELEHHNVVASGRRGTRGDVLRSLGSPEELDGLTACLFPHFRRLRRWRAGRDLARRLTGLADVPTGAGGAAPGAAAGTKDGAKDGASAGALERTLPEGWNYERIRRAAESAQAAWVERWGKQPGVGRPGMPYVPDTPPDTEHPQPEDGWGWGVDGALGVAEGAADLLRRLVWVLPDGPAYTTVKAAREEVSLLAGLISDHRAPVDDCWTGDDIVSRLQPNETYWSLRLAFYDRVMIGTVDDELERLIGRVAASERDAELRRGETADHAERHRVAVEAELTDRLLHHSPAPGLVGAEIRAHVDEVVDRVASVLPLLHTAVADPPVLVTDDVFEELRAWDEALAVGLPVVDRRVLLTRLLQLEVASTTIGDEVSTGATLPVELVQLSAQTENAFTRHTRSGDDKLGGMSVHRFGGFLKRSWRVNDWIWGRVDAATILARTVLQPRQVRRAAVLGRRVLSSEDAAPFAGRVVANLLHDFFPAEARQDPRVVDLAERATGELTVAVDPTLPVGDLPAAMPALASLFAWARHFEIVPQELPALAAAVRADRVEGANPRSRGEVFLKEHEALLGRVEASGGSALSGSDLVQTLTAFDRAGVGREPMREELSSDLTLRTATTAAAVTATVVDSSRSGLGAVRSVTRAMRGAIMLPYWVVTALTSRTVLARTLALLGLALGGVLLALALFGVLPEVLAGPATAIGASAVLVALGYGALRSGTMLHGLVLLTPVVPLVAYATSPDARAAAGADASMQGISTLVVVIALALGLMLLGSLPASTGSVWSALDRLAARRGVPREDADPGAPPSGVANAWRRGRGVALTALRLLPSFLVLAGVVGAAVWLVGDPWRDIETFLGDHPVALTVAGAALLLVGALAAWRFGRLLQVLRQMGDGTDDRWRYASLTHPVGAAAGWAVLYGGAYLVLAAFLVWNLDDGREPPWARALLLTSIALGVLLGFVFPLLAPFRALWQAERDEISRAGKVAPYTLPEDEVSPTTDPAAARRRALAVDLAARGVAYRWLVSDQPEPDDRPPSLTKRGTKLERRVAAARSTQPTPPRERHAARR